MSRCKTPTMGSRLTYSLSSLSFTLSKSSQVAFINFQSNWVLLVDGRDFNTAVEKSQRRAVVQDNVVGAFNDLHKKVITGEEERKDQYPMSKARRMWKDGLREIVHNLDENVNVQNDKSVEEGETQTASVATKLSSLAEGSNSGSVSQHDLCAEPKSSETTQRQRLGLVSSKAVAPIGAKTLGQANAKSLGRGTTSAPRATSPGPPGGPVAESKSRGGGRKLPPLSAKSASPEAKLVPLKR